MEADEEHISLAKCVVSSEHSQEGYIRRLSESSQAGGITDIQYKNTCTRACLTVETIEKELGSLWRFLDRFTSTWREGRNAQTSQSFATTLWLN